MTGSRGCVLRRGVPLLVLLAGLAPLHAEEPRAVIERAIQAHGGADNLERRTATRQSFTARMAAGFGSLALVGESVIEPHGRIKERLRDEEHPPKPEIIIVLDGATGWQKFPLIGESRVEDLNGGNRRLLACWLHEARVRQLVPLLRDGRFTLRPLPDADVEGRPAVGVLASYPGFPDAALYFDRETHLLVKTAYEVKDEPFATRHETVYGDYRDAGWAEEQVLRQAGIQADGPAVRAYLARQVPDPDAAEKARILTRQLGDDSFEVRQKAAEGLVALGAPAVAALQAATRNDDLEVSRRAAACLERLDPGKTRRTTQAAVRLLALRHPDRAAETLLALLPGADEDNVEDILAALTVLADRPGGPDPLLLRALDDPEPARRQAARAVLGKDDGAYRNRAGRPVLLPGVRLPYREVMLEGGKAVLERAVTEYQFFNRFDDREFARP